MTTSQAVGATAGHSPKFSPGQEVFDIHGNVFRYIGPCSTGHVVEPLYEADDEPPFYDEPVSRQRVFAEPPRQKLAEDLSGINAQIEQRQEALTEVQNQILNASQNRRAVERAIKDDVRFADLALWLSGAVTHLVVLDSYDVKVGTVEALLKKKEEYGRISLRLLSLQVDPEEAQRNSRTSYSAYSDGSGHHTLVRLASSEEHAKEIARAHIAMELKKGGNFPLSWIRQAIAFGMAITDTQMAEVEAADREQATKALNNAKSAHERASRELQTAESQLAAISRATGAKHD